jgi:hypothetical protein
MDFKLKKSDSSSLNSPKVILVDQDNKQLILQKLEAGAATLFNDEGKICLLSSDEDDYICFVTTDHKPALMWSGIDTTEPGIQVAADGKLQYRNANGSWKDFDSLSGNGGNEGISAGDLSADKIAVGAGKIIVGNGSSQGAAVSMSGDFSINNTGVTSIAPGVIVNADVNSSAAIAGSKIDPDFGAQAVTAGSISGAAMTATGHITAGNGKSVKLKDSDGSKTVALKAPSTLDKNYILTLPNNDGSGGDVLTTNGNGVLSWGSADAAKISADKISLNKNLIIVGKGDVATAALMNASQTGDISLVYEGVSDSLGTNYVTATIGKNKVTSEKIKDGTITNDDISDSAKIVGSKIDPDFGAQAVSTTGIISGAAITASGDITVGNGKSVKLKDDDGSNTVVLKAPASVSSNVTLTLPASAGAEGQVLKTDGSGVLSWTSAGATTISAGDLSADKIAVGAGKIIVGNGSSQGAAVSMSGDFSINNTGVTSIAPGVIVNADVSSSAAISGSKINPNFNDPATFKDKVKFEKEVTIDNQLYMSDQLHLRYSGYPGQATSRPSIYFNTGIHGTAGPVSHEFTSLKSASPTDNSKQLIWILPSTQGTSNEILTIGSVEDDKFGRDVGSWAWSKIKDKHIDPKAAIAGSKIADGTITSAKLSAKSGTSGQVLSLNGSSLEWMNPGAVSIGDTAVTSAKLQDGAVETIKLAANAVTSAKLQDGAVETIKLAANAVTSAKILDGSIATDDLADNAITSAKLAGGAVTTVKIDDGAVTSAKLAPDAVETEKIKANAVTSAKILDGSIATDDLADNAITSAKLAGGAVTTVKIDDGAVTSAKLAANSVTMNKLSEDVMKRLPFGAILEIGDIGKSTAVTVNNEISTVWKIKSASAVDSSTGRDSLITINIEQVDDSYKDDLSKYTVSLTYEAPKLNDAQLIDDLRVPVIYDKETNKFKIKIETHECDVKDDRWECAEETARLNVMIFPAPDKP